MRIPGIGKKRRAVLCEILAESVREEKARAWTVQPQDVAAEGPTKAELAEAPALAPEIRGLVTAAELLYNRGRLADLGAEKAAQLLGIETEDYAAFLTRGLRTKPAEHHETIMKMIIQYLMQYLEEKAGNAAKA